MALTVEAAFADVKSAGYWLKSTPWDLLRVYYQNLLLAPSGIKRQHDLGGVRAIKKATEVACFFVEI